MVIRCISCGNLVYDEDFMNAVKFDGNKFYLENGQFPKCPRCGNRNWDFMI